MDTRERSLTPIITINTNKTTQANTNNNNNNIKIHPLITLAGLKINEPIGAGRDRGSFTYAGKSPSRINQFEKSDTSFIEEKHSSLEKATRHFTSGIKLDTVWSRAAVSRSAHTSDLFESGKHADGGRNFYYSRNKENGQLWGIDEVASKTPHIISNSCSPEAKWEIQTRDRYEIPKLFSGGAEIQNGGPRDTCEDGRTGRRDVYGGFTRRVPPFEYARQCTTIYGSRVERPVLHLSSAAIRTSDIAASFFKNDESRSGTSKELRTQDPSVFGRFYRSIETGKSDTEKEISQVAEKIRSKYLNREIESGIRKEERIFRLNSRYKRKSNVLCTSKEKSRDRERNFKSISEIGSTTASSESSKSSWTMHFPVSRDRSDEIIDEASVLGSKEEEVMEWDNTTLSGSHPGLGLVEGYYDELGREDSDTEQSGCGDVHRCEQYGLGSCYREQCSKRFLDSRYANGINQLSGTDGSVHGDAIIPLTIEEENSVSTHGQHIYGSVHKQDDRPIGSAVLLRKSYSEFSKRIRMRIASAICTWDKKRRSRQTIKMARQKRLDAKPKAVQEVRRQMGATFDRQNGDIHKSPAAKVQLIPLESASRGSKYLFSKLARRKQLRKSAIQSNRQYFKKNRRRQRYSNGSSTNMERSNMVQQANEDERGSADNDSEFEGHFPSRALRQCGAYEQPEMGGSSIQSIWSNATKDWSQESQELLKRGFRDSTLKHYNAWWKRFVKFCNEENLMALPAKENTVAEFLETITRTSARPSGSINQACAAISQAHKASNLDDPTTSNIIHILRQGIVNARTTRAQKKATPVDPQLLCSLFLSWDDNENLSDSDLRRKSLALCVFVGMMRPSDGGLLKQSQIYFDSELEFMDICLLGFKSDGQANGETFRIWKSSVDKLMPSASAI